MTSVCEQTNGFVLKDSETSAGSLEPMAVGRYLRRDGSVQLMPYSSIEFNRAIDAYQRRIGTCHFRTGDRLLVLSLFDESAQMTPLDRSLHDFGLVLLSADASFYDAQRAESIARRFDIQGVVGLNAGVLDGLIALGHDPIKLFSGKMVWARPDAYARLRNSPDMQLRLWLEVGPAFAMECRAGMGAHIDRLEWNASGVDGEIVLSSRLARSINFKNYRTGIRAELDFTPCDCGIPDPRIRPVLD